MQDSLASFGLKTENGGPHSNHATEMALLSFPDGSYLELIGLQQSPDPKAVAAHYWSKFLQADAGPCAWAVQVPDVSAEAQRFSSLGIAVTTPAKNGRTRMDGVQLDWDFARVGPGPERNVLSLLDPGYYAASLSGLPERQTDHDSLSRNFESRDRRKGHGKLRSAIPARLQSACSNHSG